MKPLYDVLAKRELVDLIEIMEFSFSLSTDTEFKDVCRKIGSIIPFEYAIGVAASIGENGRFRAVRKMVNVSYPKHWVDFYVKQGCARTDPILNFHFGHFKPFAWSELGQELPVDAAEFMSHARDFGLSEGVTSGMYSSSQNMGTIFSFVGKEMERDPRHLCVVKKITPHLHAALLRLTVSDESSVERGTTLSKREQETLKWLVVGKSNWDISLILGISERTVRFHVENIFNKLGVTTRSQAVAVAFRRGLMCGCEVA